MSKSLNKQIEKLQDISLESVSGGYQLNPTTGEVLAAYAIFATSAGVIGALGCSIAGFVCQNKASEYMRQDNKEKSEKYSKAAKSLGIATISCAGVATTGLVAGAVIIGEDDRSAKLS